MSICNNNFKISTNYIILLGIYIRKHFLLIIVHKQIRPYLCVLCKCETSKTIVKVIYCL